MVFNDAVETFTSLAVLKVYVKFCLSLRPLIGRDWLLVQMAVAEAPCRAVVLFKRTVLAWASMAPVTLEVPDWLMNPSNRAKLC